MQAIARSGSEIVQTAKTNAVRLLDRLGVRYELGEYEVDPDDLAAETIARKVGLPPEQVFKTLVARGDKHSVCLSVVPSNCELDLKALGEDDRRQEDRHGGPEGGRTADRIHPGRSHSVGLQEALRGLSRRDRPVIRLDLHLGGRPVTRSSSTPTTTSGSSRSPRTRSEPPREEREPGLTHCGGEPASGRMTRHLREPCSGSHGRPV